MGLINIITFLLLQPYKKKKKSQTNIWHAHRGGRLKFVDISEDGRYSWGVNRYNKIFYKDHGDQNPVVGWNNPRSTLEIRSGKT